MKICVVTDAAKANKNPDLKMSWSDHVGFQDEKMVKINENTSQPTTQENKKCVLSARMISPKDHVSVKPSEGGPMNLSMNC